jgi:hypothetical protein
VIYHGGVGQSLAIVSTAGLSNRFWSACLTRLDSSPVPPMEALLAAYMRTSSSIHNTRVLFKHMSFLMIPDAHKLANGVG